VSAKRLPIASYDPGSIPITAGLSCSKKARAFQRAQRSRRLH